MLTSILCDHLTELNIIQGQWKASWRNNDQIIAKKGKQSHHKLANVGIEMCWCMVYCRSRWRNRWKRSSGFISTSISLGGLWHHTGGRRRFSRITFVHWQSCRFVVGSSRIITCQERFIVKLYEQVCTLKRSYSGMRTHNPMVSNPKPSSPDRKPRDSLS